jgi:hypothetical protein
VRSPTLFAAAAALLAVSQAAAHRPAAVITTNVRAGLGPRARGVVHVHTGASPDGGGDVDDVAQAAREAGLDFVVVTDHNTEASLGIDAYRHGVLVLGGYEKSSDGGHALVLGLSHLPFRLDGDPATVVRDTADLGGFVVAAHPLSSRPEGRWTAGFTGIAGVESLNLAEPGAWPRGLGLAVPLLRYALDPQGALLASLRLSREPIALWDQALASRPLAGFLGSDAHGGVRVGWVWLPFPSHAQIFRCASQRLLLQEPLSGEAARDRTLVLEALRSGRSYLALDSLADASGLVFEARSGGRAATMGESLALEGTAEIRAEVDAPAGTELLLLRNGAEVARAPRIDTIIDSPGAYRLEAQLDPRLVPGGRQLPWILTNAISIFPSSELEARAARAAQLPPGEPEAPEAAETLDAFDGPAPASTWLVDRSADATGRLSIEGGALRFDFGLGPADKTHAAAVDWRPRDLAHRGGLVFRVRADRPLRFDVQVRVARLDRPEAVRIFRRSVRVDTAWRRVSIRFSALETYDHDGGRPNLAACRGIFFHVDEATLRPGSRGTLFVDDLGLAQ